MEFTFVQVIYNFLNCVTTNNYSLIFPGASIIYPEMPAQKGFVRGENGPGCWVMTPIPNEPNKCVFQWLLDTNLKVTYYHTLTKLSPIYLNFVF